jgi:uncharacterized protein (DUF1330 family)
MAKAYWVSVYRSVSDPAKMKAYGDLAGPALAAAGGKILARQSAAAAWENGLKERVVIIQFDSVDQAVAAHQSPAYQAALKALDGAANRDMRIVEGLE